jgi:hypothetical protein
MLFKKKTPMYCKNHTKDMNAVCGGGGGGRGVVNVKSVGGLKPISERVKVCYSFLHKISKTRCQGR